jgi:class 3 adenylate cyclase
MVLLVLSAVVLLAPSLSFIELRALDVLYALRSEREPDPRIELIDSGGDPSVYDGLRDPREPPGSGCETPRLAYAEAVRRLSRWGAKVIVFDLMFRRSCEYEDEQLAEAFREAGNVIVAATTKTKPGAVGLEDPVTPLHEAAAVGSPVAYQAHETVRSVPLLVRDRDSGREYRALCLEAFQRFKGAGRAQAKLRGRRWLVMGDQRVPVLPGEQISLLSPGGAGKPDDSSESGGAAFEVVRGDNVEEIPGLVTWNTMLLNWVGPEGTIRPHHLSDLLAMDDDVRGREMFDGKAVIIGQMDWDAHWTAVGAMPGPEVQANALHTLMSGDFIRPISPWAMIGVLLAFSLGTSLAVRRFRGMRAIGAVVLLVGAAVVLARHLLVERGVWMYLFYCELGIGLTWGMTVVAESDKVTNLLTRFVPSFIGKPEAPGVGEVRTMDASILFSDIRGYTGIAEQLSAADTLTMLNTYQSAVEDVITRYGGTIVKTPGDAILAVFWKDVGDLSHATCALRSGEEILRDLPAMGRAWEAVGVSLKIGIGIDAGQVAMALVGKRHLEPTVIGDAVNVAQRLETLTKTLGCPLVFSENVRERLREDVETVCLDELTVRGRKTPLRVYGVAGPDGLWHGLEKSVDLAGKEKTE